jgi:hypothetical protein
MTLRLRALPLAASFLLPTLLLAAGLALGGLAFVLLLIVAALITLDRVLDRTIGFGGWSLIEAEHTYRRLARQRRRSQLAARMRRREPATLRNLPTDTGWAAVAPRRRLGTQPIEIDSIVGSVDGPKALAFDRCFRPPRWSRGRWTQMCLAVRRGTEMPPIAVYRVGGEHFVRDGHHRVSVGRALGAHTIDADVVVLEQPGRSTRPWEHGNVRHLPEPDRRAAAG